MKRYAPEEIDKAAAVIRGSFEELGRWPTPIFFAFCETAFGDTVELIVSQPGTDKILLTQRSPDDPYFPNIWHIPGVMLSRKDERGHYPDAIDNASVRARDELEGTAITPMIRLSPQYLHQLPRISERGGEISTFFGAYLLDIEPRVGQMFDVHELPEPMLDTHRDVALRGPEAIHLAYANLSTI